MDQDAWLGPAVHRSLPWILTAICILLACRHAGAFTRLFASSPSSTTAASLPARSVPTLDGNCLYYGKAKWPQYEARFNLRLCSVYGPVVTVRLGATNLVGRLGYWLNRCLLPGWQPSDTTILINSLAEDDGTLRRLLNSCPGRALSIPAGRYLSRGRRIVLQPYGPDWQRHRRAFSSLLTKEKTKTLWSRAVRFEALVMAGRLARLTSDETLSDIRLLKEVSRFTASNVLQIAYARRASTPDDPVLGELEIVSQNIASAFTPGKYWVETFPILDWLPLFVCPWKRKLDRDHAFEKGLFTRLLGGVEAKLSAKPKASHHALSESAISVNECAAAYLLDNRTSLQLDRDDIAYLAAGLFEAGTETTAMTINTFLLAAACYPRIVQRAQAELDARLGHGNRDGGMDALCPPEFEDLQEMEYLGALVQETLRLTPTGSSGVGHTPSGSAVQSLHLHKTEGGEQDMQRRLDIPPNAMVLGNIYGLHHDPILFSDPWAFDPTRWLVSDAHATSPNPNENNNTTGRRPPPPPPRNYLDPTHRNAHPFGFGRRICPGATLASYTLSMAIAMLLFTFDIDLTPHAQKTYQEMKAMDQKECNDWASLYPNHRCDHHHHHHRDRGSVKGEQQAKGGIEPPDQPKEDIGRTLLDAHVTFRLSKEELAECIRLTPRRGRGRDRVRAVQEALAGMQKTHGVGEVNV